MKRLALLLACLLFVTPALAEGAADPARLAARDLLAQLGYTIPDDAYAAYCEAAEQMEAYAAAYREDGLLASFFDSLLAQQDDPMVTAGEMFVFAAHGSYDYDTDTWTPWLHHAYAFDAEIFNISQMYTLFLQGVGTIAPDASFTDITEDLSGMTIDMDFTKAIPTDGTRSVSFLCNGQPYQFTLESRGDWFNENMIVFVNQVLAQEGCSGQLYPMAVDGQSILLVYGSEAQARTVLNLVDGQAMW